jgi:hypothetical protein
VFAHTNGVKIIFRVWFVHANGVFAHASRVFVHANGVKIIFMAWFAHANGVFVNANGVKKIFVVSVLTKNRAVSRDTNP